MEVLYKVPDSLVEFLEFIPNDKICEMITTALSLAVKDRCITRQSRVDNSQDILLEKIQEMLANQPKVNPASPKPKPVVRVVESASSIDTQILTHEDKSQEDIEMDFLLDIMK